MTVRKVSRQKQAAVVEDDGFIRELLTETLKDEGFEVMSFADGLAALTVVESDVPLDLLIVDIGLPRVNGRAIVQVAMSMRPQLKIIMTTGHHEFQIDSGPRLARLGKPFTRKDVTEKIAQLRSR